MSKVDVNSVPSTVKRIWDDLRTIADNLAPFSTPIRTPLTFKEAQDMAEALDDTAARLFKLAERIKESPQTAQNA